MAGDFNSRAGEECATGDELAVALRSVHVDTALLDIRMPGEDVFEVLAQAASVVSAPQL